MKTNEIKPSDFEHWKKTDKYYYDPFFKDMVDRMEVYYNNAEQLQVERDKLREALEELRSNFCQHGTKTGDLWDICNDALKDK